MEHNWKTAVFFLVIIGVVSIFLGLVLYKPEKINPQSMPPPPSVAEVSSPDLIAFSMVVNGNENLYTVDLDGNVNLVANAPGKNFLPSWSMRRELLAYIATDRNPSGDLYLVNVENRERLRITSGGLSTMPVFSKDSSKVYFLANFLSPGNKELSTSLSKLQVFVLDVNESNLSEPSNETIYVLPDYPAQIFEDGRYVAKFKNHTSPTEFMIFNGAMQMLDKGRVERLTGNDFFPMVSPFRREIAFQYSGNGSAEISSLEIFVSEPDGSNRQRLTNNGVPDLVPEWSPDGRMIAYIQPNPNGNSSIVVMGANGCCKKRLVTGLIPLNHFIAWSR